MLELTWHEGDPGWSLELWTYVPLPDRWGVLSLTWSTTGWACSACGMRGWFQVHAPPCLPVLGGGSVVVGWLGAGLFWLR
jgi:hypothetical protein